LNVGASDGGRAERGPDQLEIRSLATGGGFLRFCSHRGAVDLTMSGSAIIGIFRRQGGRGLGLGSKEGAFREAGPLF